MEIKLKLLGVVSDETGQGIVEYALILSLIVMVVVGFLSIFGGAVLTQYETFISKF